MLLRQSRRARYSASLLALGVQLTSLGAWAHQIWIDQQGSTAQVRFGEYAANLAEASPGYLDKLNQPDAWLSPTEPTSGATPTKQVLTFSKKSRGLQLSTAAANGQSLVVQERSYPLLGAPGPDAKRTWWIPAARYLPSLRPVAKAELQLDILPTDTRGGFRILYRNQPLDGATVSITAESGWMQESRTDEAGTVHFALPWRGDYLVHLRHKVEETGRREGETYHTISYSTGLGFAVAQGLAAPPRPAPAAPNPMPPAAAAAKP